MALVTAKAISNETKYKVTPKNILFCEGNVDGTVGGSYLLMYDLVRSLDRNKYRPMVVFYKDNFLVPKLRKDGIDTHVLNRPDPFIFPIGRNSNSKISHSVYNTFRPVQRLVNIMKRLVLPAIEIAKFLKKKKVDLVNLNNSITRNHEWMLATRMAGIKCMTHEMGLNDNFSFLSRLLGKKMEAIVCLSYAISDNMKSLGVNFPNIYTIHCGIDNNRYKLKDRPIEIKKRFDIGDLDPVIGVVGNIKKWKGQETVVRATAIIKRDFPNVKCLLVGGNSTNDRSYYEKLQDLCSSLNIESNVIFAGFQENAIDFMNTMDVVIHTSIEPEPFGIVNLEAMLLKKPMIATNMGGPAEIFINKESGILVPPGDSEQLAKATVALLHNHSLAKAIGEAGYTRLMKNFTLEENVKKTVAVYEQILNHNE